MLESLYLKALEKKGDFHEEIESLEKFDFNAPEKWNKTLFESLDENFIVAAGDGSKHEKKFLRFIFYGISAESLIYTDKLNRIESSDIGLLLNQKHSSERIRNYMEIFEIKNALKTIKTFDVDYYLYDGSILGNLIRPFSLESQIPSRIKKQIESFSENGLKKYINDLNIEISSNKLFGNDSNEEFPDFDDYKHQIYLEYLEKLISISNLLKHPEKIVAISKTSTSNDIFRSKIPDISIFENFIKSSGFSNPHDKIISNEIKHSFPIEEEFFKSLTFTIFYLRLENHKNILKIELPYKADNDQIKRISSILFKDSAEGYPYLLKKAHHDVVITKKDIEHLSKIVGIMDKSGREML